MAEEPKTDFQALAKEAAGEGYDPRAKRCWPWSHAWTMWEKDGSGEWQTRRCVRCGKEKYHRLVKVHAHKWKCVREGPIMCEGRVNPVGHYEDQRCAVCGALRHVKLVN